MSFLFATPEYLAGAATDLSNIGSTISSANAAALAPTSGVLAPGADEVSATIAALFDAHSQAYQALSAQAALFHQEFVNLMSGGAAQYALAEAENASPLLSVGQTVESAVSAPVQALAQGAAPIGNGASAVLATGTSGASGTTLGAGGTGAAGQLVGATTATTAAADTGGLSPAASFAAGGTAGSGGLIASGGAGPAVASAEEVSIAETGEASLATAPASGLTRLAAVPAAAPASSAAAARPATPAYSPATAAAESSEE